VSDRLDDGDDLRRERSRGAARDVPAEDPVLLLDETEDGLGAGADLDAGETGSSVLGELGEAAGDGADTGPRLGPPASATAADRVPPPAEESAVHIVDEADAGLAPG